MMALGFWDMVIDKRKDGKRGERGADERENIKERVD
jgi:hypothetical protein